MEVPPCGTNCTAATIKLIRTTPDAKMMATFAYKLRAETGPCENTSDRNASCRQHHTKNPQVTRTMPHDRMTATFAYPWLKEVVQPSSKMLHEKTQTLNGSRALRPKHNK